MRRVLLPLLLLSLASAGCEFLSSNTEPNDECEPPADSVAVVTAAGDVVVYSSTDGSVVWQRSVGSGSSGQGSVVVGDEAVYAYAGGSTVHALDHCGEALWNVTVADELIGDLAWDGTRVYGSGLTDVVAIEDGAEVWSVTLDRISNVLDTAEGSLFVAGDEITRLNGADGTTQASFQVGDSDVRSLVEGGGTLYVGGPDRLIALASGDLTERWNSPLGVQVTAITPGSDIYIGTNGAGLRALSSGGQELWTSLPSAAFDDVLFGDGRVYAAQAFGALIAFDATDGSEIWRTADRTEEVGGLVSAGNTLYFASGSLLTSVNAATGDSDWKASPSARVVALDLF